MCKEMAVLMSPTEHANLWNSEVKIHRLGNSKCKCSVTGGMTPSCDTLWRLRPEFSLSVGLSGKQYRQIGRMNSWMIFPAKKSPVHTLQSRNVGGIPSSATFQITSSGLTDDDKILKCLKIDSLAPKQSSRDLNVRTRLNTRDIDSTIYKGSDFNGTFSERDQPHEEPWLLQSSAIYHYARHSNSSTCLADKDRIQRIDTSDSLEMQQSILNVQPNSKSINTLSSNDKRYDPYESNQPVEEPWLFEFSLFLSSNTKLVSNKECVKDEATHPKVYDQLCEIRDGLFPEVENNAIVQEDSVSTVILINSSVCTMQRIAVLEDGKLVELILEPVKDSIQCDSIYLAVVSKLVPQLGGAFVDIGSHRPCLMSIKDNREPFVFPPFCHHTMEGEVNGLASVIPEEIQNNSSDVEAEDEIDEVDIDDVSLHDEYAEHELVDDYDIQEVLKENLNGSLPRRGEVGADNDDPSVLVDGDLQNIEDCSDNSPPSQLHDKKIRSVDASTYGKMWGLVQRGTKIIVQVVKEGWGAKGPTVTPYPKLRSRFWVLSTRCNSIGISKKISGPERIRLRFIARNIRPEGFGLVVRTVAAGHSFIELRKDLEGLLSTWKDIMEHAKSAANEGGEGATNVMLHSAMDQTLSVVQDYFTEKVKSMVVDSQRTYHEVTKYLQEIAPGLCDRVELYSERTPLFDKYNIEEEMSNILSKSVSLDNGGYLVIEQTEALVSVDVNGGSAVTNMLGQGTSQEKAVLNVNLAAANQIARELRLRDIGGIIIVDFIDMEDNSHKRLVYEEVKNAVERDRSAVDISELSKHGLMEITRKRVRPSVTFMISEPCTYCQSTGRVEALDTSFSKIEREICRLLAKMDGKADPENTKSWPRFILLVDRHMFSYLTSGKRTKLAVLSSSLKVWILPKVARGFHRGGFEVKPLRDVEYHNSQNQVSISRLRRPVYNPHSRKSIIRKTKTGRK